MVTVKILTEAERVASIRRRLGLTQTSLALLLGVTLMTVVRWEDAKNLPKSSTLILLGALERASFSQGLGPIIVQCLQRNRIDAIWKRIFTIAVDTAELPSPTTGECGTVTRV